MSILLFCFVSSLFYFHVSYSADLHLTRASDLSLFFFFIILTGDFFSSILKFSKACVSLYSVIYWFCISSIPGIIFSSFKFFFENLFPDSCLYSSYNFLASCLNYLRFSNVLEYYLLAYHRFERWYFYSHLCKMDFLI